MDKAKKNRDKWLKVLENREKNTIEKLTEMRMKMDTMVKKEKEMKKRYDEEFDYKVKLNLFIKIGRNEALKRVEVLRSNLKKEIYGQ